MGPDATTDASGIATVGNWSLGSTGGNQITATASAVPGQSITFTATGVLFDSLTVGSTHVCALSSARETFCWGQGRFGSLGFGSNPNFDGPVPMAEGLSFVSISAGAYHTCGLTSAGAAYCWGWNSSGQLGDGSTTDRGAPQAVSGSLTFAALSAGDSHTCGITTTGAAYCWGRNWGNPLGDATSPVAVAGGLSFSAISSGGINNCALTGAGAAYCWDNGAAPAALGGGLSFVTIAHGYAHACGMVSVGVNVSKIHCWGTNTHGPLGDGTFTSSTTPVPISSDMGFRAVTAGDHVSCAITIAPSQTYCWGYNGFGAVGDGTNVNRNAPVSISLPNMVSLSTGPVADRVCALQNGIPTCWGPAKAIVEWP
jgi:alpha-tubulin suppressor-like RCC1 family protein